jgi:hypothetical protein
LNVRWPFKPATYGYEPLVTDASKANEQYTKNVRLQYFTIWRETGRGKQKANKQTGTAVNAACQGNLSAFHCGHTCHWFVSSVLEAFHDLETLVLWRVLILADTLTISAFIL